MSLLGIGTSALLTSQGSLSTTSHNISNVNTEGYTRQRTDLSTRNADYFGGQYFGTGVQISSVERIYDGFLTSQVRSYTSQESQQNTFYTYSQQVDDLLGSSELSLSSGLTAFFSAVNDVADDPTSTSARQLMLTQGELLANQFNTLDDKLVDLDKQVNYELSSAVDDINSLSASIAEMNQAIVEAKGSTGASPNDLLDQRDALISQLSSIVSVTTVEESNGSMNVMIGDGQSLVVGSQNLTLSTTLDSSTTPPRVNIVYDNNQNDITSQLTGGIIGGAVDFRTSIIDNTRTELDLLAKSVVEGFNAVHNNTTNIANGGDGSEDLDGNDGADFFDAANITAATISVAITDPREIAASSKVNAGSGNNENMLLLADLESDTSLVTVSGTVTRSLSDHYSVLLSDVATQTKQAGASQETQQALLEQTQQRLDAVSGVNLDEEAANLIKYQQAYQAASQIIVASNTIFDSLMSAI